MIDFQQWLANPSTSPTLLVYTYYYVDEALTYLRIANNDYVSLPPTWGGGEDLSYDGSIVDAPIFTRRMSPFFGNSVNRTSITFFANDDINNLLDDDVAGRSIYFSLGDATWAQKDFKSYAIQYVEQLSASSNTVTLDIRDMRTLDVRLDLPLFTSGIHQGKNKPYCNGTVFNIAPLLIESSTHKYCYSHGSGMEVTQVRDNGVSVAFTLNAVDGEFTLNQAAQGKITCDVASINNQATPSFFVQDMLYYGRSSSTDSSYIDLDSILALPNIALGLYYATPPTAREAIDLICRSIHYFYFRDRLGVLHFAAKPNITGVAEKLLGLDDIIEGGVQIKKNIPPSSAVTVTYAKNYTLQPDNLAGSVSDADRLLYAQQYASKEITNTLPFLTNGTLKTVHTCLVNEADATVLAQTLATESSVRRRIIEVDTFGAALTYELGQEVELTYGQYGFDEGVNGILTEINDNSAEAEATVQLWI
jgi:hypothetical protein